MVSIILSCLLRTCDYIICELDLFLLSNYKEMYCFVVGWPCPHERRHHDRVGILGRDKLVSEPRLLGLTSHEQV